MNAIVAVLPGFLLVVVPIYSQQYCEEGTQETKYYIYNANVETKTYFCSYSDEDDTLCKKSYGKILENDTPGIVHNCKYNFFRKLYKFIIWERSRVNICELRGSVKSLNKILKFSDDTICMYHKEKCYAKGISKNIFWTANDICDNLAMIYNGEFNVWTTSENQFMFIKNENISLILRERIRICGCNMWITNHNGIIASKHYTSTTRSTQFPKLQSNFSEFCQGKKDNEERSTDVEAPKIWYVYKYPINVTVYRCFTSLQKSCEDMNIGDTVSRSDTDLLNQCKTRFDESKNTICRKTLQVDIETDSVRELPPNCTYSGGICQNLEAFWQYINPCSNLQKEYQAYEEQCSKELCVIQKDKLTKLTLLQEGKLCGENIRYSDQEGIVASQTELLERTNEDESLIAFVDQQNDEIKNLQTLLYYIMCFIIFCVLWCVFNVIVNYSTLKKINKARASKKRVPLVNCVSQSLTTRYMCIDEQEKIELKDGPGVQSSRSCESVNNELYNEPFKEKNLKI